MPKAKFIVAALMLLACAFSNAQDDISRRVGNYEVFYSAFNTSFLSPEVASALGIVRAKDRAMINISVRRYLSDSSPQNEAHAVSEISGNVYDLIHRRILEFDEIQEPGAIYYLAEFDINNNNELMQINVSVVPEPGHPSIDIQFKRYFYLNE